MIDLRVFTTTRSRAFCSRAILAATIALAGFAAGTAERRAWLLVALLVFGGCVTADQMYVPTDSVQRAAKTADTVVMLEKEPDREYVTIGLISPPPDEYESIAEALNAARRVAAQKGADAIIVESADTETKSGFTMSKWDDGVRSVVNIRVKAIVWR